MERGNPATTHGHENVFLFFLTRSSRVFAPSLALAPCTNGGEESTRRIFLQECSVDRDIQSLPTLYVVKGFTYVHPSASQLAATHLPFNLQQL